MKEGQIPSRTLMSLNMIFQVAINQHYGHHVTNNVWTTIKHLSPHLGIIVVSGLRVVYTIIIVRISYDIFITKMETETQVFFTLLLLQGKT